MAVWQDFLEMSALSPSSAEEIGPLLRPPPAFDDEVSLIDFSDESKTVSFSGPVLPSVMSPLPSVTLPLPSVTSPLPSVTMPGLSFSSSNVTSVAPMPTSVRSVITTDGKDSHIRSYKMTDYWPLSPVLWFEQAESAFSYYGETVSRDKYHRVLMALPESVLKTVSDIVANPPVTDSYECLKDRLLASVRISDYQKADRLMAMPSLGDRRPSDMMASMLDQCPRGWSHEKLFVHLFLSRLPQHLRVLLRTRDTTDLRALAEAADELHDLHLPSTVGQVNACLMNSQIEPVVAAVAGHQKSGYKRTGPDKSGTGGRGGGQPQWRVTGGGQSHGRDTGGGQSHGRDAAYNRRRDEETRMAKAEGLCWYHWTFGHKAKQDKCVKPCTWVN